LKVKEFKEAVVLIPVTKNNPELAKRVIADTKIIVERVQKEAFVMKSLKDLVQGKVKFKYVRDKSLWYSTECGFIFPVPLSDTAGATFNVEDKASYFMRWIRKYREECDKELMEGRRKLDAEIEEALNKDVISNQEYLAQSNGYIPKR